MSLLGMLLLLLSLSYKNADAKIVSDQKKNQTTPPNIILIYADDLGWNDVSFHGSPSLITPNIDALAMSGIVLQNYYGQSMCSPSRGALMTGKYPIRLGLQHFVIRGGEASGLPLNETTLAQHLKKLGYRTHLVGKWHLGCHTKKYTPLYRGFDTFFGYMNAALDYYDYSVSLPTNLKNQPVFYGRDLYNGIELADDYRGQYATNVFAEKAREVILNHDTSKPLFLYLSHLAVHAANAQQRLQAPPEIIRKFKYIKDINRRIHAAMTYALDLAVGDTFKALQEKDMLKNSIVLFMSDNGGNVDPSGGGYSSNYPLRGKKGSLWEGGVRLVSLLWSPLLKLKEPRISTQLMHVSDWLPTLYRAADGDPSDLGDIDGFDMWGALIDDLPSPRKQLLNNVDPIFGMSAYRKQDLKVVNGTAGKLWNKWFGPTGFEDIRKPESMEKWVFGNGSIVRDILKGTGMWIAENADAWYEQTAVHCKEPPPKNASICNPVLKPCLFNITADPCEYNDIADQNPELVDELMNRIHDYEKEAMKPQWKDVDPDADPMCHNFAYVPWLDPENYVKCDYAS